MPTREEDQKALLLRVARRAMIERGLEPDFSPAVANEAERIKGPAEAHGADVRDQTRDPWCSIDNDDSLDLDQLTVAESQSSSVQIRVAVADVSALVELGSAIDDHAQINTTSVYTPPRVFPMLPDRLSTDLTSLVRDESRLALIVDMTVDSEGDITTSDVYRAMVKNRAKLAYPSVGAWLEGTGPMPEAIGAVPGLADNLRLQDRIAQLLKARRHEYGALDLDTLEARAQFDGNTVKALVAEKKNRARGLIEDFMIAANGVLASFLEKQGFPVLRRVVRSPERWPKIVEVARALGEELPSQPDSKALNQFLVKRRAADPLRFPDLSLTIIKLLGRGEYVASFPGDPTIGHFGLAVSEYTHSTAPNRRYPDLITQRLLRAALAKQRPPYARDQIGALATHCTLKEDAAQKVERLLRKAAAACLLSDQIGHVFEGVVTGVTPQGTWTRIFEPPAEGRIDQGAQGLDVGDQVKVKLLRVDPERGFIDFARFS